MENNSLLGFLNFSKNIISKDLFFLVAPPHGDLTVCTLLGFFAASNINNCNKTYYIVRKYPTHSPDIISRDLKLFNMTYIIIYCTLST